jgi:hypothetical protein
MPCFEGLFPPTAENVILDLLFMLATWHALAKLRMHTTSTLSFFDAVTKSLGEVLRRFANHVCPKFNTKETPSERAKGDRRSAAKAKKGDSDQKANKTPPKKGQFNLSTYKIHALGHYPAMIRRYGTTDSYTTQTVLVFSLRLTAS